MTTADGHAIRRPRVSAITTTANGRVTRCPRALARALVAGAALLVFVPSSSAGGTQDLLSAVRDARTYDAQLASALAVLDASGHSITRSRSSLLPKLEAGWQRTQTQNKVEGLPNYTYQQNGWTVSLTQPLLNWESWVQLGQSNLSSVKAEIAYAKAQQDLLLRVATAYFDVLMAQDELNIAALYKQAVADQLALARKRFKVGEATLIDVREAEAKLYEARTAELAQLGEVDLRRDVIENTLGHPVSELAHVAPDASIPSVYPRDGQRWSAQAEEANYDVQLAEIDVKLAQLEVERARSKHLPTVNLIASHRNSPMSDFGRSVPASSNMLGLQVTIPLFSGLEVQGDTREALALADKARSDRASAARRSGGLAKQSFLQAERGLERIALLNATVEAANAAVAANTVGYRVGGRTNTDVLNAQQGLYAARRDLARTRYETILNGLRLKTATASLNDEDFVAINRLLTGTASTP
jgi:outer membrane protein